MQGGRASTESLPLSGTESARNDNGGAVTQPLSGQPTIRPAAPIRRRRRHPRMHPHCVGDYREKGCVYRHAVELVGVSAGGITPSGKKTPLSSSLRRSISLHIEGRKTAGLERIESAWGRCTENMKVATARWINQNSRLNGLVRIFRRGRREHDVGYV